MAVLEAEVESLRNTLRFAWGSIRESRVPASRSHRKQGDTDGLLGPYAGSLEKVVGDLLAEFDPENEKGVNIEGLKEICTNTTPGPRVLRITGGSKG